MPQPVSNTLTVVSGSLLANKISYVVDGQNRNYRGGFGGLSWMSEAEATNNVIFIGNTSTIGRGPADKPLFYPSFNTSDANIIYAANTLPGSPRNLSTVAGAYSWAANNNFFINSANSPIPRVNGDSLALYIDADQPTSYPQTGTSWFDLSGIGNNSALYNGPTWNSRGYIDFDGTDDFVGIGNTGVTKLNQNYQTLRFLTYITSVGPNGYAELYAVTNANRTGIKWQDNGIGMDANGDFYNVFVDVSNAYSRWMDITCVIDRVSNIFKVYKNGTYIGQDTFTGYTANSTSITVGANNLTGNGGDYIKGSISEISVYGKELSLAEVKQNYFQGNIVTNGLVFMLDANNLVSYPRSGTNWYSLTSSFSASLVNGPAFNNLNGGSIVFDGTDDYGILNPSCIPTGNEISISFWNFGINAQNSSIIASSQNSSEQTLNIHLPWGNSYIYWDCGSPFNRINKEATSSEYQGWHHWVFTKNASTGNMSIYLDGLLWHSGTGLTSTIPAMDIARIGSYWNNAINHNGRIAQCLIYNKALTATEIQQNYNETKYKFQGQQIVTNGLVLNLDAANKDSYPGTGTTWYDLSGNGINGYLTNGPTFLPNQNGGIFNFDYVDDYVNIGNNLGAPSTFTLSAWVRSSNISQPQNIFNGNPPFFLRITSSTIRCAVYTGTWIFVNGSITLSSNTWYNLVLTYDQSTVKGYVNGVLDVNSVKTGTPIYGALNTLGYTTGGEDAPSVTNIAVAQAYNRALSSTEVLQNYNAQKTRFGL